MNATAIEGEPNTVPDQAKNGLLEVKAKYKINSYINFLLNGLIAVGVSIGLMSSLDMMPVGGSLIILVGILFLNNFIMKIIFRTIHIRILDSQIIINNYLTPYVNIKKDFRFSKPDIDSISFETKRELNVFGSLFSSLLNVAVENISEVIIIKLKNGTNIKLAASNMKKDEYLEFKRRLS